MILGLLLKVMVHAPSLQSPVNILDLVFKFLGIR